MSRVPVQQVDSLSPFLIGGIVIAVIISLLTSNAEFAQRLMFFAILLELVRIEGVLKERNNYLRRTY